MPSESTGQLCLAQNQYALFQDATKGTVSVYAGPYSFSLSGNDRPVVYDRKTDSFVYADVKLATAQNSFVPEGHYLVLENPSVNDKGDLRTPAPGSNGQTTLLIGRKIVIPGPAAFPLWPGQFATAIPGHHLRSNQYLVIRVYNAEEATKNSPEYLKKALKITVVKGTESSKAFTPGALLVIKGTEVPFFIPPTGFEVLKDENDTYVREALTLERLEYAILLDEDGNKRFENGPKVVFPEATERFFIKDGQKKFKALELNDQMGLFVKVIAEKLAPDVKVPTGSKEGDEFLDTHYKAKCVVRKAEGSTAATYFKVGEELFLTGKELRIYYPCAEHALIEYDDPTKGYKRQRYYGITIPDGEGRYVLDKTVGRIKKVEGPMILLPDPRNEIIIRRVLDDRTVNLWYPGNTEALAFNLKLRELAEKSTSYLAEDIVLTAAADAANSRGLNRGTVGSKSLLANSSYEGDTMRRGTQFTPPPMITLSTKFDGIPSINVYTGYAVLVTDKKGHRRIVVGPDTIMLEYDETLAILTLSTGKPKTTDNLKRDVYLQIDHNLISDVVRIETKDLVPVDLKLSYRVNFLREHKDKWFNIENYVKYLCDHMRSMLKGALKKHDWVGLYSDSATIIRDVVLGPKATATTEGVKIESRHRFFSENGMDVYDIEVLDVGIANPILATMQKEASTDAVKAAISLTSEEQELINTRRKTEIDKETVQLQTNAALFKQKLASEVADAQAKAAMAELENDIAEATAKLNAEITAATTRLDAQVTAQEQKVVIATSEFERVKTESDYTLLLEKERTSLFEKKMAAITPNLIQALTTIGETEMMTQLSAALAPLALNEQTGLGSIMERVFKNTPMEQILSNIQSRGKSLAAKA